MNIISSRRRAGFTLTELMAVVIIVAVLAAVGAGTFKKAIERSHFSEGLMAANTVLAAVERYYAEDMDLSSGEASFEFNRPKIADLDISLANPQTCKGVSSGELPYCIKTKYFEITVRPVGSVDAVRMKDTKPGEYSIRVFPESFGDYQRTGDACIATTLPGGKDLCISLGYTNCNSSNYCYK